jgi:hypothetical protein
MKQLAIHYYYLLQCISPFKTIVTMNPTVVPPPPPPPPSQLLESAIFCFKFKNRQTARDSLSPQAAQGQRNQVIPTAKRGPFTD